MKGVTHKHIVILKEISKVFVGLILADISIGLWLLVSGIPPFHFFGLTFTSPLIYGWVAVDLILLAFFVHFAWRVVLPVSHPKRIFLAVVGVIFLIVGLAHLFRLFFDIPLMVDMYSFPYWLNVIGVVGALFLSWTSFVFAAHRS